MAASPGAPDAVQHCAAARLSLKAAAAGAAWCSAPSASPCACSQGRPPAPASGAGSEGRFAQKLDEDRWLAAFEVPGVAVALVRDGRPTWAKGYGQADMARGVAVTPDTVFQVGSISKSVDRLGRHATRAAGQARPRRTRGAVPHALAPATLAVRR